MTLIITVTSTEIDGPRKEARRLESIITQEEVDAFVVPGACLPEILQSWGVRQLPVFRINNVTVWEGETPPTDMVRSWLHQHESELLHATLDECRARHDRLEPTA